MSIIDVSDPASSSLTPPSIPNTLIEADYVDRRKAGCANT